MRRGRAVPQKAAKELTSARPRAASPVGRNALESTLRRAWVLARRGLRRFALALVVGVGVLGRLAFGLMQLLGDRRVFVVGLLQRVLWWSALALFLVGGRELLSPYQGTLVEALPYFIVGFALCALAILMASSRRIRWAALALGFGHGTLGLLLWTVLQG